MSGVSADIRTRVAVIGGVQNCEHAVSLATAASVARTLDPEIYDVVRLTIAEDGRWLYDGMRLNGLAGAVTMLESCDVVFPAVHGPGGEDGTLAALCELAGVAYVGSDVRAGALAMDKWTTKLIAEALGIRTARGVVVMDSRPDLRTLPPCPVVVKPVAAGSSHGVTRVDDPDDLEQALKTALALDDRALVEELVDGREIDIAVLDLPTGGRQVGPALEIVVEDGALFDTDRKYDGTADFRLPADVDRSTLSALESAALALHDALGCAGVSRFDFFVTDGGVILSEVNTMPGMTEESQVPKMFAAAGMSYAALLDVLIDGAIRRTGREPRP